MAESSAEQARTANRLSLAEQMTAAKWLLSMAEEAARIPQTQLAEQMATFLGRPVTVANLGTVAEAVGVRLHGFPARTPAADWERALGELRGLAEKLELRVLALERSLGAPGEAAQEVAP